MSPTTQLVIVGFLVAGAAAYLLRSAWQAWFGRSQAGCGAGCRTCANGTGPREPPPKGRFPLPQA